MQKYSSEEERTMINFYKTLNEKDRRRYAASEAKRLGRGGGVYISQLFGCTREVIIDGKKELEIISEQGKDPLLGRCRRKGGGRKQKEEVLPNLDKEFLEILKAHTAGNPMDENIIWTDLKPKEIVEALEKKSIIISIPVVKRLLKKHGYVRRKSQKQQSMKNVKDRDAQFQNIEELKSQYMNSNNPIISFDTKKKSF